MNSDESRLRALEQSVDSLVYHIKNIMEDSPSALEKATENLGNMAVVGLMEDYDLSLLMMQKAFNWKDIRYQAKNSNSARFTSGNYQINTTHYYIKFSPQDSLQYERIANDTILAVSDIPFEYDIETDGDKYQDPDYTGLIRLQEDGVPL